MASELRPCGCGGIPAFHEIGDEDEENFGGQYIECPKCGSCTKLMFPLMDSVRELLADDWNTAHPSDLAPGLAKAVEVVTGMVGEFDQEATRYAVRLKFAETQEAEAISRALESVIERLNQLLQTTSGE